MCRLAYILPVTEELVLPGRTVTSFYDSFPSLFVFLYLFFRGFVVLGFLIQEALGEGHGVSFCSPAGRLCFLTELQPLHLQLKGESCLSGPTVLPWGWQPLRTTPPLGRVRGCSLGQDRGLGALPQLLCCVLLILHRSLSRVSRRLQERPRTAEQNCSSLTLCRG